MGAIPASCANGDLKKLEGICLPPTGALHTPPLTHNLLFEGHAASIGLGLVPFFVNDKNWFWARYMEQMWYKNVPWGAHVYNTIYYIIRFLRFLAKIQCPTLAPPHPLRGNVHMGICQWFTYIHSEYIWVSMTSIEMTSMIMVSFRSWTHTCTQNGFTQGVI